MAKELLWTGVGHQALPQIWGSVEKFISKALEQNGFYDIDHLYYWDRITQEDMQLWVLYENDKGVTGVMLTELHMFMNQYICNIPICAGASVEKWEEFRTTVLEPWCEEHKVDRIEFRARKSIAKLLAKHNYYVSDVTITKQLTTRGH